MGSLHYHRHLKRRGKAPIRLHHSILVVYEHELTLVDLNFKPVFLNITQDKLEFIIRFEKAYLLINRY